MQLLSSCRLTAKQESLRILPFPADFEGSKILEPWSIRCLGIGLSPKLELVEVIDRDLAIAQAIKQMVAKRPREIRPLDLALFTERHSGQFFFEALLFRGVR